MKTGFTLIELLVVVLIIGILAAVALPQYTKAVEKTRAAEAFTNLKAIVSASEIYFMIHDKYPTTFDGLDLDFGANCTGQNCMHGNYYFRFADTPAGAVVAYVVKL